MSSKYHHIAIALAGAYQSAMQVPQLANSGQCNTTHYNIAIKSLFNTDPSSVEDVFGGVKNIKTGLQGLTTLFQGNQSSNNMDVVRYIFGVIGITHKLIKNNDALDKIAQRLERIKSNYPILDTETIYEHQDEISYALGGIYSDIISPLTTKIRVTGRIEYLQNTLIQAKIRASLLGCIRSAILWHQVGGKRLQFLLSRAAIIHAAHDILNQLDNDC